MSIIKSFDVIVNKVCSYFPTKSKESDAILGIFVVVVLVLAIITLPGVLLAWIFGIPWWSTWAAALLYYMIVVAKTYKDINK